MTDNWDFLPRLRDAARSLRLSLTEDQESRLLEYLGLLQRWNRAYNLTAVRDPSQMLVQHIFDSLAIVPPVIDELGRKTGPAKIVDVGSGAGLPGVVLATLLPHVAVHCVDTVEKKATFIRYAAGVLRLANLQSHHARVEELAPFEADIVVSRAFASLADFATLGGAHVAEHGWMLAMKGREPQEEIAELSAATKWRVDRIQGLQVPELDAQRCLVWLKNKESHEQ